MLAIGIMLAAIAGYVLGSIPTGYLVAKARGVDIRNVGSGNIGATNVFRILGTPAGVFVLLTDAAKGWVAVLVGARVIGHWFGSAASSDASQWFAVAGALGAVLGHNYTVWLRFKGGKGIATSAGALAGLVPLALLISVVVFVSLLFLSRYVSLASISSAFILPFAVWYWGYGTTMTFITAILAALAIYKHKSNIQRLVKGTESRLGRKPPGAGAGKI